jgi:DinB family protein
MAEDRSYIEANTRERERLRALVETLDDDALTTPGNEYWTIAGVLGHIAFWDVRVLVFADKIDRGEPWVPSDDEPEGDWLNDSTRPRIHAIAPRAAAELSPVYAVRADHRGEHLDQIEAALKARGRKG